MHRSYWQQTCGYSLLQFLDDSEVYNYKNLFSVILLAVYDTNYWFSYIEVGTQGRCSDSRVFDQTSLNQKIENNELLIISCFLEMKLSLWSCTWWNYTWERN